MASSSLCDDTAAVDSLRQRFLTFALDVNKDLDRCGFHAVQRQHHGQQPAMVPDPGRMEGAVQHLDTRSATGCLLNATIFFDFRPLFGKFDLAESMRRHLLHTNTIQPDVPQGDGA
jgi:CBS domain-containing protein